MSDPVYRKVELVGTSATSIEDAIAHGVAGANLADGEHADWFEVQELRGHVREGKVSQFQVVFKLGVRTKG